LQCPLLKSLLTPASEEEALSSFSKIKEVLLFPLLPILLVPLEEEPEEIVSWKLSLLYSALSGESNFSFGANLAPRFFIMHGLTKVV